MGTFDLVEFQPDAAADHGWRGIQMGALQIELPFLLAASGLGSQIGRPLQFQIIRLQVDLVTQLVHCPTRNRQMRARPHLMHASASLKRLAAESVGLASAAALAEQIHGWNPLLGWPTDLDLLLRAGIRADLLFPRAHDEIAAEARGRTRGRRTLVCHQEQANRMAILLPWAHGYPTRFFMAWAWITQHGTRVDHFLDMNQPQVVRGPEAMAATLSEQSRAAYDSAAEAEIPAVRINDIQARGLWTAPSGTDLEVFVGVIEPDAVPTWPAEPTAHVAIDQPLSTRAESCRIGPVLTAVRERGDTRPVGELDR